MSSICDDLRAAILQAAMQGRLTGTADEDWNESKIEDVCELSTGNSISESIKKSKYMKVSEGRNYIGTKDLGFDHSFNYENGVKIPFDENNFRIANSGDILLCIEGGSAGRKIGILEEDVNYGNKLCRFSPNGDLNNRFLYFYIQSPLFQEQFSDSMAGIIGGVSIKKIKAIPVKYPSITEQKRIVEKVDELMARVADLEQSVDALASLKKAFPDDIKASLLQAAMQGKLTEQLPEDGDAEELLDQIKAEKERLIAEGKIKKQKPLALITDDEIPFSVPDNWKWVWLRDICTKIADGDHNPPKGLIHESEYLMLSSQNINNDTLVNMSKVRYLDKNTFKKVNERTNLQKEDILFTSVGSLGRSCIFREDINACFQRSVSVLTTLVYNEYLKLFLDSPFIQNKVYKEATGTAQKGFYLNQLEKCPIAIPPLSEQKRIVGRLDDFMRNVNAVGELIASE